MKTLILLLCLVASFQPLQSNNSQKAERRIKKELASELGYLIGIEKPGEKPLIVKTVSEKEVEKLFHQETGLKISVKTAMNKELKHFL